MGNSEPDLKNLEARKLAYEELCKSYHQIDDFRSKLLAALPVASAGGVFLLIGDKLTDRNALDAAAPLLTAIGIFGAIVTLALFCYEVYGIRKCGSLIDAGIALEKYWAVDGQFTKRPNDFINEPFAAGIIYPAVLAGWVFLALYGTNIATAISIAVPLFFVGFAGMVIWNIILVRGARAAEKKRMQKTSHA